ncbi:hypothetical protein B0A55_11688, partial [Friedmanniomyces simplex]
AITAVWIAKSNTLPSLTEGLLGLLSGSSQGVLTAYSLGATSNGNTREHRFGRGQVTACWALSPGVPLIAIAVIPEHSLNRQAQNRIWAVVLNALGEVFYLTKFPKRPHVERGTRLDDEGLERMAWLTGRTTGVDGSYSPRSSWNGMCLSKEQVKAETREIEDFAARKPKDFRKALRSTSPATMVTTQQHRKANLKRAQQTYERYLKQLDHYDVLGKGDGALLEQYQDSPNTFSTASTVDAAARRDAKIKRFRAEKALKQKLEYMRRNPSVLQNDEAAARELHLTEIAFCTHRTFQQLESVGQELHILSLAPPSPPPDSAAQLPPDARERNGRGVERYNDRLDAPPSHLSAGMRGPILDTKGKPLRPFTLTSKRQEFANGVFRPDHSLPTMSIDEYLEEERKRGGMIEGGGPQSEVKAQIDEDDLEAADCETMKAREWDEYVEANPKGSGNTLNRG